MKKRYATMIYTIPLPIKATSDAKNFRNSILQSQDSKHDALLFTENGFIILASSNNEQVVKESYSVVSISVQKNRVTIKTSEKVVYTLTERAPGIFLNQEGNLFRKHK